MQCYHPHRAATKGGCGLVEGFRRVLRDGGGSDERVQGLRRETGMCRGCGLVGGSDERPACAGTAASRGDGGFRRIGDGRRGRRRRLATGRAEAEWRLGWLVGAGRWWSPRSVQPRFCLVRSAEGVGCGYTCHHHRLRKFATLCGFGFKLQSDLTALGLRGF
jgi:hypothetical protein